jgi:FAD/FMN-containing dehydrogenase
MSVDLRRLLETVDGEILTAGDASYDEARRLWNGVHDLRPGVIVRPRTPDGVATALRVARDH